MSVALTLKYKGKIESSRIILSNQTGIHEGVKAPHNGEHSNFPGECYPSWLPKESDIARVLGANTPSLQAVWSLLLWSWQPLLSSCATPAFHHHKNIFAQLRSSIFLQMMISANSLSPGCNPAFQVSKFKQFLGCSSEMQEERKKRREKYFQNDTNGI